MYMISSPEHHAPSWNHPVGPAEHRI